MKSLLATITLLVFMARYVPPLRAVVGCVVLLASVSYAMDTTTPSGENDGANVSVPGGVSFLTPIATTVVGGLVAAITVACRSNNSNGASFVTGPGSGGSRSRSRSRSASRPPGAVCAINEEYVCCCGRTYTDRAAFGGHSRSCALAVAERKQHHDASKRIEDRKRAALTPFAPVPSSTSPNPLKNDDTLPASAPVFAPSAPPTPTTAPVDTAVDDRELADANANKATQARAAFADLKQRKEKLANMSTFAAAHANEIWLASLAHDLELSEAQLELLQTALKTLTPQKLAALGTFSSATALKCFHTLSEMGFNVSSSAGGYRADRENSYAQINSRDVLLHATTSAFAPGSLPYISGERTQAEIEGVAGWQHESKYVTDAVSLVRTDHEETGMRAALQSQAIAEGCYVALTHVQGVMANEDASAMGTSLTRSEEYVDCRCSSREAEVDISNLALLPPRPHPLLTPFQYQLWSINCRAPFTK